MVRKVKADPKRFVNTPTSKVWSGRLRQLSSFADGHTASNAPDLLFHYMCRSVRRGVGTLGGHGRPNRCSYYYYYYYYYYCCYYYY